MASRPHLLHCRICRAPSPRWVGRCPGCGEWNTLEAEAPSRPRAGEGAVVSLAAVDAAAAAPRPTGVPEFDRVLAGGLVPGSATLLFGEPGVGKSTLLLQVLASVASAGATVLLVSAEESAPQVRTRATRIGPPPASLLVCDRTDLPGVEAAWRESGPTLVVVDSVQAISDPDVPGTVGSLSQVRACADRLVGLAKSDGAALVLVGHVTKGGEVAGPRTLEHLVDTVVSVEGDRHHALRTVRALKHRFGPTGEVGLFTMSETGLVGLEDPGALLLGDRNAAVPGSAVTTLLEGRRPLVVELQALVCDAPTGSAPGARRNPQGVDAGRLGTVLAVLESRLGVPYSSRQVFVSAAGGVRAAEPATDLPMALALLSAVEGRALPEQLVSFGEIGLAGELRQVPGTERRLAEAARMGLTMALVPASSPDAPPGVSLLRVGTLAEAVAVLRRRPDLRPVRADPAPDPGTMRLWSTAAARP